MKQVINFYKFVFLVITHIIVAVALIACFTDVSSTLRLAWIIFAVSCIGVITTWKIQEHR